MAEPATRAHGPESRAIPMAAAGAGGGALEFYGPELARIHAEGFADRWDPAVDWLADLAREPGRPPFAFELGCGDGRLLAALAARGVPGAGVDLSAAFAAAARARGLAVTTGDAARAAIPPATLVLALGETLAYADPGGEAPFAAAARTAHAALVPGGAFVFDLTGPATPAVTGWREGDDWLAASATTILGDRLGRRIVCFVRHGAAWRRNEETHHQRLFDPETVAAMLAETGFAWTRLETIGPVPLLPGRIAFLARRR